MLCDQVQHHRNRHVGAAAARKLLDAEAGIDDVERVGPGFEDFSRVVFAGSIEHFEESLVALERVAARGEAIAGKEGGEHTVARRVADMQRLRHGAEIGFHAGGERDGARERSLGLRLVEPEQPRGGGGRAEDAERRSRVPALLVVLEMDRAGDSGLDLVAGDVGGDRVTAVGSEHLAERNDRRNEHGRRVPAQCRAHVVVVERVRGDAVDQDCIQYGSPPVRPEDETRTLLFGNSRDARRDACGRLDRACEGHADRVDDGLLGPEQRSFGQVFVADCVESCGKLAGDRHGRLPPSRSDRVDRPSY